MSKNATATFVTGRGRTWPNVNESHTRTNVRRGLRDYRSDNATNSSCTTTSQGSSVARFEEACEKIRKSTEMFLKSDTNTYSNGEDCSSDDEQSNNDCSDIINKVLMPYSDLSQENDVTRTEHFLLEATKSGANVCLICISSIKKTEGIWTCDGCYCVFHLPCLQTWAKDSVHQQATNLSSGNPSSLFWCCPKCRKEYSQLDCPTKYTCFCGKVIDPEFDPWLIPHTCGQKCDRPLRPFCGHICLLLCHPGPCPPCPKMVQITCHCGQQKPQARRCSNRLWSCGKVCGKKCCLQHRCKEPCHEGLCPPCPKTSVLACCCGREKSKRPCADATWHCTSKCDLPLSCGHHNCKEVCHSGKCKECPRLKERTCPCGKNVYNLPCFQDIPTCGDTCGKPLACGIHKCAQRCHTGPCGTCLQMTVKNCRCGQRTKSIPCHKDYFCEIKCKAMKNCGRHACNRKCCEGNCPNCEQLCGRSLRCRNHKCNSPCHQGPCYPCPLMAQVTCRCVATVKRVPCGMEKDMPPPKCSTPCQIPPLCHHESYVPPHNCHFGLCPPCRQPCGKQMTCSHSCPQRCHSNVLTKVAVEQKRAGPWEPIVAPKMEYKSYSCPPCQFPVPVTCLGKHETKDFPCSQAIPASCGRSCGQKLTCGNHLCSLPCHIVSTDGSGNPTTSNCETCKEDCSLRRPEGCPHPCLKPCHKGSCPTCRQMSQFRCLCGLSLQYVSCIKWTTTAVDLRRSLLLSCGNQCPKQMSCGHRCSLLCHDGPCSSKENCQRKVNIKCECKRLKMEFLCKTVQQRKAFVQCDAVCKEKQENEKKRKHEAELQQRHEEMQRNKEEVEKFQRKMANKKRSKPRKEIVTCDTSIVWRKDRIILLSSIFCAFFAVTLTAFFLYN